MQIFDVQSDLVIRSIVASGRTTYSDALNRLFPLIDRFEEQRKLQRPKFYNRLRQDIISGCIMPPITIAFVSDDVSDIDSNIKAMRYINEHIDEGYILDGMQRLNTLMSAKESNDFDGNRPIYMNVVIAAKYDLLLYRMITLNNGQKPMTVRHQVEMLTGNLIKRLVASSSLKNMYILTEKDTESGSPHGAFKMSDVAAAYLSFLTGSAHNQNTRFIEEKLDEILVGKVMASGAIDSPVSFEEIIAEVDRLSEVPNARNWLRNENNLIGFTLSAKSNLKIIQNLRPEEFAGAIVIFETAFQAINPSKVNVGKFRRDLSHDFVSLLSGDISVEALTERFFELTAN